MIKHYAKFIFANVLNVTTISSVQYTIIKFYWVMMYWLCVTASQWNKLQMVMNTDIMRVQVLALSVMIVTACHMLHP